MANATRHPTRTRIPRGSSLGRTALGICLSGAFAGFAHAGSWNLQTGGTKDNEGLMDLRSSATWISDGTSFGYPSVRVAYHGSSTGELAGIPGGTRDDLAFLGTLINGFPHALLTSSLGMDALQDPQSWRAQMQLDWKTGILGDMRATAAGTSGWMEGWLAREVRANSGKLALGWDGPLTWAETGLQLEDRYGGRQPENALPISLANDLVTTMWIWGMRSWTSWLQMGLSANASNSTVETHQPVNSRNDTLLWIDAPYGSPHEEAAVSALIRLSASRAWVSAAWPMWSTSRRRVDAVYSWDEPYWYTFRNASVAEIKAGGDFIVLQRAVVGLEAKAISLPYRSYAWFSDDAWNQYGLNLTVRFSSL